ncbi:folate-binding protein YgfZ [bacterium]|nr:folate-binding protein YgfZ [bacterium]
MPAQNRYITLPWRAVHIRGADAETFLNGQLTARVPETNSKHCALAAYCLPNGRMLGLLWLWREHGNLLMATPADNLDAVLQRLRLFVLRSDVQFETVDSDVVGLIDHDAAALTPGSSGLRLALADGQQPLEDSGVWTQACIDAGIATIVAATRDTVIPQMIGLEQLGGLDFRKGCYPGQEIVARLQYKGTLKQRMYRVAVDGAAINPGDPLQRDGSNSGLVLAASNTSALVLARVQDAGQLVVIGGDAHEVQLPESAVFPEAR